MAFLLLGIVAALLFIGAYARYAELQADNRAEEQRQHIEALRREWQVRN